LKVCGHFDKSSSIRPSCNVKPGVSVKRRPFLRGGNCRSAEKIALAAVARQRASVTNAWLAERLSMGTATRVSRYCGEAGGRSDSQKLVKRIEMANEENF